MSIRLDRYLADVHIGTRKMIRQYIMDGRVKVNGEVANRTDTRIEIAHDTVEMDGKPVVYSKYRYIMLNKPAGAVSATKDGLSRTVIDLLQNVRIRGLFPVGRLDKDTEGLLLLTDDGDLAHRLLSPKKNVDKTYEAHLLTPVTDDDLQKLAAGIDIGDDTPTLPARAERAEKDDRGRDVVLLTIREGRFHQVKRMFHAVGSEVVFLRRLSMGVLKLDPGLKPGAFRNLSADEIAMLKEDAKGGEDTA